MFKYLIKGMLTGIAVKLLGNYRSLSIHLLKIEAVKRYLHGVRMAREASLSLVWVGLLIALMFLGALLLHAGLFILLPWSVEAKAGLAMILGFAYVLIGVFALLSVMSEKAWLEKSGAAELLKKVAGQPK